MIKIPIKGFKKSTFISFAEFTLKYFTKNKMINDETINPIKEPIRNSLIILNLRCFLKTYVLVRLLTN